MHEHENGNGRSSPLIFIASMAILAGVVAGIVTSSFEGCTFNSPVPPPESPIEAMPLEEYGQAEIWWDDPSVEVGYSPAYCAHPELATMYIDWKLVDESGAVVHMATVEVPDDAPTEIGTGKFSGPFPFEADIGSVPKTVTIWVRPRWDLVAAYCVDESGDVVTGVVGIYVPPEGQTTEQDADGYWRGWVVVGYEDIYLPFITK